MAAPPRLTWPKANLGNLTTVPQPPNLAPPSLLSTTEIQDYSRCATILLGYLGVHDPASLLEPSQSMLETLAWLSMTVFPNALQRYSLAVQATGRWIAANTAVNILQNDVNAAAGLHVPPLVLNQPAVANIAIESALELLYESVLLAAAPATFVAARTALAGIVLPFRLHSELGQGLPEVGVLCCGNPTVGAGPPRLVISCSFSKWKRFSPMGAWMKAARQSPQNMPDAYRTNVRDLSTRLANRGFPGTGPVQDLQQAWDGAIAAGPPANPDAALAAAWVTVCGLAPPAPPLRTYIHNPAGFEALPFNTRNQNAKGRCRRCRVIFLFSMNGGEPREYTSGPYDDRLSCAEVSAYQKCLRYGI